jgi:hypothetical protein
MSAVNGDKARFHRERKGKAARRARTRELQKKIAVPIPAPPAIIQPL